MANVCINCGRKMGAFSGERLGGNMCVNCYDKFTETSLTFINGETDPYKYLNCYEKIAARVDDRAEAGSDKEKMKELFYNEINFEFKRMTGLALKDELARQEAMEKKELAHVEYAHSLNEFYEYDVVTILNVNHGRVDKAKMMGILSEYSRNGWKLHSVYSNELGKNAISVLGFGSNSTACEDVLIFERRIKNID